MTGVVGVPLGELEDPIRASLTRYSEISDASVEFDVDSACRLELTPDKPNSARSATSVRYLGEVAATLYVIAFAPEDGTGDESAYKLEDTDTDVYSRTTKVIPRKKTGMASETHLTILSKELEAPNTDPVLFAGNFDLIGFGFGKLCKLAELGQSSDEYTAAIKGQRQAEPTSTLTTGYLGTINDQHGTMWNYWRRRFGDPHAVYNSHGLLQVCGFIGISSEDATYETLNPLRALNSSDPQL